MGHGSIRRFEGLNGTRLREMSVLKAACLTLQPWRALPFLDAPVQQLADMSEPHPLASGGRNDTYFLVTYSWYRARANLAFVSLLHVLLETTDIGTPRWKDAALHLT